MFVESMSFEQMRKHVIADLAPLTNKFLSQCKAITKVMRKTNMSSFRKYYDYIAPKSKNQWLYGINIASPKAKGATVAMLSQFTTQHGYCAISYLPSTECTYLFKSHFFTRYNERTEIGLVMHRDIMIAFLNDNPNYTHQLLDDEKDSWYNAFIQFKHGAGLGVYHKDIKFFDIQTFVANDMLKGEQIEISKSLEKKYNLEIQR